MSRLLYPIISAAAALGAGWWLGARPADAAAQTPDAAGKASAEAVVKEAQPAFGLARRAGQLRLLENPSAGEIQRLLNSGSVSSTEVFDLAKEWAEKDPAGMWRWLSTGGNKKLGSASVTNLLFEAWFRVDAEAALAAMRGAHPDFKSGAMLGILSLLKTGDEKTRKKVVPLLDELTEGGASLPSGLGTESEDAANLMALPASRGRDSLLMNNARSWMDRDWKGATAWAAGLTEPLKSKITAELARVALNRNTRLVYYAGQKEGAFRAEECFEWAREWMTTTAPVELRRKLGPKFVEGLAGKDPGAALTWAQGNLAGRPLGKAITSILERQAGSPAARTMVEQLPPGGVKERAAFAAAGWHNAESVQWLRGQVDRKAREWGTVGSQWAFSDPDGFRKFVTAEKVKELPNNLLEGAAGNLARKDPAGTVAWAVGLKSPELTGAALREWGNADGAAAAGWLKEHAGAAVSSSGVQSVASDYFRKTPEAAVEWVAGLPPGKVRDGAMESIRVQIKYASLEPEARAAFEKRLGKP